MAGASLTTVSALLKDLYIPPTVEQLNNEVLIVQRVESSSKELIPGNKARISLHKTRSGGIGDRIEDEDLPTAGNQGYAYAEFDIKYKYGRFRVTGPSMVRTSSDAQAFLSTLRGELDGLKNDLRRDMARQCYADGSAKIAQCGTTSSSTTVQLNTTSGAEAIRKGHLHVGMNIDIGTAADPTTIASARSITSVSLTNSTVVISGAAVTTSSSHYVFRAGNSGNTTNGVSVREIDGLQKLVASAANTVGGIDASAAGNDYWDNLRATSVGTITIDKILGYLNEIDAEGGDPTLWITTPGVQRQVFNQLQAQVRYTNSDRLSGGFKSLDVSGYPLVADKDCPNGTMFLLTEKHLKLFSDQDWHFLEEDGKVLKWVDSRDAWQGVMARYMNLGIDRRKPQYIATGITDSTGL